MTYRKVMPLLCVALIAACNSAAYAAEYTVAAIPTVPGGDARSVGYGLNNLGQVVGQGGSPGAYVAILWQNGVTTDIGSGLSGQLNTSAVAINDAGQVAVNEENGTAWRWNAGTYTRLNGLPLPPGGAAGSADQALGINSTGTIVGSSFTGFNVETGITYAALWSGNAAAAICPSGSADAINDNGQIAGHGCGTGTPGFFRSGAGPLTPIPIAPHDINNAGVVAGHYLDPEQLTDGGPAIWSGGITTLLDPGSRGEANGINQVGQVVGVWRGPSFDAPFIWDSGKGFRLLTDLVATDPGITLVDAVDINDHGQILVNGYEQIDGTSYQRAYLLTPVPLPAALLFPSALTALGWVRRRVPRGQLRESFNERRT